MEGTAERALFCRFGLGGTAKEGGWAMAEAGVANLDVPGRARAIDDADGWGRLNPCDGCCNCCC